MVGCQFHLNGLGKFAICIGEVNSELSFSLGLKVGWCFITGESLCPELSSGGSCLIKFGITIVNLPKSQRSQKCQKFDKSQKCQKSQKSQKCRKNHSCRKCQKFQNCQKCQKKPKKAEKKQKKQFKKTCQDRRD